MNRTHLFKTAGLLLGTCLLFGIAPAQAQAPATAPAKAPAPVAATTAAAAPATGQKPATSTPAASAAAAAPVTPAPATQAPAVPAPVTTAPVLSPAATPVAVPLPATASPTDSSITINQNNPVLPTDSKETRDFIGRYKKCMMSETRMERLSCYDDIASRMNIMPEPQKLKEDQILGTYGFWRVIFTRDDLGRDKTFLKLESSNQVKTDSGIVVRPALTVSCQAERTDVYIDWKYLLNTTSIRKYLPVVFSIDSFPPVQQNWQLSNDNYAVYAPDPAKMIRAMKDHLKMIVTMTAENEQTSNISFDLPGLDNVIKILIRRCYPRGLNPTQGIRGASDPAHPATSIEVVPGNSSTVPSAPPPSVPMSR